MYVFQGFPNEVPQTEWLKNRSLLSQRLLEVGRPRSRYQLGWFLLRAVKEDLSRVCLLGAGSLLTTLLIPWLVDTAS